jgi:hypothetical protein
MKETEATVTIHAFEVLGCLQRLTTRNPDFDHRQWSIHDAELLEEAARLIRRGYAEQYRERSLADSKTPV